jgi:hypothetical protein
MAGTRRFEIRSDITASWFETRGVAALLTMRVSDLILRRRKAPSRRMQATALSTSLRAQRSNPSFGARGDNGLLRFARNDGGYSFAISRRISPEICIFVGPPLETEGAGKTGCLLHPRSRVRFAQTKLHTSIQGSGSIPAFPAQWLYGLLRALPGERLSCLRRPQEAFASLGLNASTAAPEPHDFAVRIRRVRPARHPRPSHLTARS